MYKNKKILAIIPARGGSKGIPHKNIMKIGEKPLIAYSIEAAKESKYIDYILVSTDDTCIKEVSLRYGAKVPFLRPDEISTDRAKSIDVVLHGIDYLKEHNENFHYVILLQPTSPLRTSDDIDTAIESVIEANKDSLISVCECSENPILMRTIEKEKLKPVLEFNGDNLRRQELPTFYVFNGAIYINKVDMLQNKKEFVDENTMPFIMDIKKSIDIDNMIDAKIAEMILKENKND
ncbi:MULTISPECIES: acylneuraminate cytidylyltransferase family protein [Clostridium]|uniref:acylneuraminate cytidylyltransferase family protein n=1 Tax=Clostridium TaxID=1485 RepID=UPI000300A268|nr:MULTISPECIES: acylneuraminate cytidylyltransferase family protein [Clostridium]KEH86331.1 acylneuraminate cytidylyltransferase [Clostridium novyi A str. 4540]KEH88439.1 acylneuraminate cytidylyltransferase [Clostridium novyi A str. NCTC 538]KEH90405.1 acylneuraminate cytidylyltransferase [Clostridium novyi A str. BKT29909]KEH92305.1 acylneuraminate cytidylyltransferase [Clostridium novyi A str. GD211209]KEH93632.1 acylneuraminate cytidylyltransferase [Clostridium botulinum C/D str. It1]